MNDAPEGTLDALHQLLAERARYESWITQLDGRRGSSPGHVLDRVRGDYAARLESVTTQLRGRAVELEATAATLRSRLMALATEEETRRDERAETELRAAVGEFSEDEARITFERCDGAIGSLVAQRDALGSELAKLQEVLVLVVARPEPVVSVPESREVIVEETHAPEPTPSMPSALDAVTLPEFVAPAVGMDAPAASSPSAAAELEFLRSIVSHTGDEGRGGESAELVSPPVLAAPRRQPTPLSGAAIRDPLRSSLGDTAGNAGMTSFLKDMPTEQVKTLKCQECGTMNYPTEWYCERCGGELAAM